MKTFGLLAVVAVLVTSAFAQTPGFYVGLGGGPTWMSAGDIYQTTSYGEILKSKESKNTVAAAHVEVGYRFGASWELGLWFTDYPTAQVMMDFPRYTGLVSIVPFPEYYRHVFLYDTSRFSLVPSYTFAAGDRMRLRAGLGVVCSQTSSHFEADYRIWNVGLQSESRHEAYQEERKTDWSYVMSLGAEWVFHKNMSLGFTSTFSPYKIVVPSTRVSGFGATQSLTRSVKVTAIEAMVSFIYRK